MDDVELKVIQTELAGDDYDIIYRDQVIAKLMRDRQYDKWRLLLKYDNNKYILQSRTRNLLTLFLGKTQAELIDISNDNAVLSSIPYNSIITTNFQFSDQKDTYKIKSINVFSTRYLLEKDKRVICYYNRINNFEGKRIINIIISEEFKDLWETNLFLQIMFGLFLHILQLMQIESITV